MVGLFEINGSKEGKVLEGQGSTHSCALCSSRNSEGDCLSFPLSVLFPVVIDGKGSEGGKGG